MSDRNTFTEYRDSVNTIALEAFTENREDPQEYISESVDGSSWIIYYNGNDSVIEFSSNEPDGADVREMSAPDADWRQMKMTAAYLAMEADVNDAFARLEETHRLCDEETAYCDEDDCPALEVATATA